MYIVGVRVSYRRWWFIGGSTVNGCINRSTVRANLSPANPVFFHGGPARIYEVHTGPQICGNNRAYASAAYISISRSIQYPDKLMARAAARFARRNNNDWTFPGTGCFRAFRSIGRASGTLSRDTRCTARFSFLGIFMGIVYFCEYTLWGGK